MPAIKLDITPATDTHCFAPEAHVLNPNARCPMMRIGSESSWCVQFNQHLSDRGDRPERLPECLSAGQALRETESLAELARGSLT